VAFAAHALIVSCGSSGAPNRPRLQDADHDNGDDTFLEDVVASPRAPPLYAANVSTPWASAAHAVDRSRDLIRRAISHPYLVFTTAQMVVVRAISVDNDPWCRRGA
jgi:hypothetical protein